MLSRPKWESRRASYTLFKLCLCHRFMIRLPTDTWWCAGHGSMGTGLVQARSSREKELAFGHTFSIVITDYTSLKAPIFVILEEDAVEGMHIFFSRFCFRMFFILVIKLWVRQRWEWGIKQNTEWSQIQFLSLSLSANSFTFPTELARKNSSENYTKRCFSFWLQRVSHGWLTPAFAALGWRCTVTKAPGWPWETASALSPSERSL